MSNVIILVTIHKQYPLPSFPTEYHPVQVGVGKIIDSSYLRDNTGNHIASKNSSFCELTVLYWAWKNLNVDILGLCHYRRYLGNRHFWKKKSERILKEKEISSLLASADIILPKKRHYWIETRESQYVHAHHIEDLQMTEAVLREKYSEYLPAWKHMLSSSSGHICNMFIMRWELVNEYCSWLFDVLFEVEKRLDISSYSDNDRRVFGFLGERLLDVWVETKRLRAIEVSMINLEKQHWLRKGLAFVTRKRKGKKDNHKNRIKLEINGG